MRSFAVTALYLAISLWVFPTAAEDSAAELELLLRDTNAMSGVFTQQTSSVEGDLLEESGGVFRLLRPDYFYWEINQPDHQVFWSDGSELTHYDVDLEQAVIRKVKKGGAMLNPAQIIAGNGSVAEHFSVVKNTMSGGTVTVYQLAPKQEQAAYRRMDIHFTEGKLFALEMIDGFAQTTRIELSEQIVNGVLSAGDFTYELPAGIDLIHND
jgi:outer membrane lipoprotein carrier protein